MREDIKGVELFFNHYDENDYCYGVLHFIVEKEWLENELAPLSIEDFINSPDYDSDETNGIYDYALLFDKILKEWEEYYDTTENIIKH